MKIVTPTPFFFNAVILIKVKRQVFFNKNFFAVFEKKLLKRGVNLPDTSALARSVCKIQILPG